MSKLEKQSDEQVNLAPEKPAETVKSRRAKRELATTSMPPVEPGSGGDVILWIVVDLVAPGQYEVVTSMDKIGVRKASKRSVAAENPVEAGLREIVRTLHALKHRRPNSVTIKCNLKELVDIWKQPMLRCVLDNRGPGDRWEQFLKVKCQNGDCRLVHVVPDQIEAAGLAKEMTRHLDKEPRPFGVSETVPQQAGEVE